MFRKFLILFLLNFFWNTILFCQVGANNFFENADHICFKQPLTSDNIYSNSLHSLSSYNFDSLINCINLDNSSWYKFSTNSSGGSVDVLINQIACSGDSNFLFQNSIEVVFIYADLNLSTESFEIIDLCHTLNSSLYLTLPNLLPDKDYYILIDGYEVVDPDTFTDVYNDAFLKKYTTALIKRQWGLNLIKFEGMQMPGGVTLNGRQIFDDAKEEIEKLEEEMQLKHEMPPHFFIG